MFEANSFVPLFAAGGYTVLLLVSFMRQGEQEKITRWLLAFLVTSILWEFLIFVAPDIRQFPGLSIKILLVSTSLLGLTTTVYADWLQKRRWIILSIVVILIGLLTGFLGQARIFSFPGIRITYNNLITHLIWLILSGYILLRTWREYQHTLFPWHANRLLFWVIALLLTFLGEAFLFIHWTGLTLAGQIVRFIGVASLTYAISSHRIFDVRTRSQNVLALFIITLISGSPLAGAILLVQWLAKDRPISTIILLTVITITIGFFLYQPLRRRVERIVYRYLLGEGVDTRRVVRNYSQAVYRTLDVNQLSLVIIGTLSELLETNRGALLLMTEIDDAYEIEPIPAMGHIPRQKIKLTADSPFMTALVQQHQPLLQYEIDFNPDFAGLGSEERSWLKELAMEIYVPVSTGTETVGLIAIGPRNSGVPYQPGELELAQILADQTVVAVQNSRLYSELTTQNEKIRHLNVDLVTQNERLEIMDRVKSDFITIASHELRTPLTQVKGYADILSSINEEDALTREQTRGIVGHIDRAAQRLEELIAAMLDASQLDVDGMQLTFVQTTMDMVLRLATEPLNQAVRERRISIKMEGVLNLPTIQADFKRLVQAFTNLIGNAVKYTPDHGSITINTAVLPSRNGKHEFVEVIIADTGIGIDPQYHELIFEKFFRVGDTQLHSTGSTKFKGAGPGLGLPIAKGVIEAHGGRIWVESEMEDEDRLPGSRFHIVLPLQPPDLEVETAIESDTQPVYG